MELCGGCISYAGAMEKKMETAQKMRCPCFHMATVGVGLIEVCGESGIKSP